MSIKLTLLKSGEMLISDAKELVSDDKQVAPYAYLLEEPHLVKTREKTFLTEEEKRYVANGGLILSGVMQRAEARNGNGRVYPMNILEREVKNYKKLVKEKRALGELDHPESSVVNLANASHIVTAIWFENEDVSRKNPSCPSGRRVYDWHFF